MKNVTIGKTYNLKVGANLVAVQIKRSIPGGWEAVSYKSGKTLTIKDAKRLTALEKLTSFKGTHEAPAKAKKPGSKNAASKKAAAKTPVKKKAVVKKATKPVTKTTNKKKMSLLDAAAHLLSLGTKDPMTCRHIVVIAEKRGLWTPGNGLTPANTLYSSILREIKDKGAESRFVKTERGKFGLAKNNGNKKQ